MSNLSGICQGNKPGFEFKTFDDKVFSYDGNCSYLAAKHTDAESDFEIR